MQILSQYKFFLFSAKNNITSYKYHCDSGPTELVTFWKKNILFPELDSGSMSLYLPSTQGISS